MTAPTRTIQIPTELEAIAPNKDEYFAAKFLGTKPETLRSWRKKGIGPRYSKVGTLVRYSTQDLINFAANGHQRPAA